MEEASEVIDALLPRSFKGDSHALLMAIYKDESQPLPLRLDAAKAAIGYEKPKLAAVEHSGNAEKPVAYSVISGVDRMVERIEHMDEHAAGSSRTDH